MRPYVETVARNTEAFTLCYPNAGMLHVIVSSGSIPGSYLEPGDEASVCAPTVGVCLCPCIIVMWDSVQVLVRRFVSGFSVIKPSRVSQNWIVVFGAIEELHRWQLQP